MLLRTIVPASLILFGIGFGTSTTPTTVQDAAGDYAIDAVHSSVLFRIKHMDVAYFYGRFTKFGGDVTFDAEHPEQSSIAMTIDAGSVYTANRDRDRHIEGPDFFNVEQFPEMAFQSTKVEATGEKTYRVTGDLTFHGETHPVVANVEWTGVGEMRGTKKAGFEASFTFQRSDFGLKQMIGPLGDEVRMIVSLELNAKK
ncbi:MAG: YceI family protein [Planctomycetes bacterium]|nr:YceI family protein [Planctomycetota bacterium]